MYLVPVTAAVARLCEIPGALKLSHDLGCGAFGDADLDGDVAEPERRVGSDRLEDVGVVRYEPKRMIFIS